MLKFIVPLSIILLNREYLKRGFKMVRGLYTAGTGMLTQRNKINVIANNVANVETTGYKEDLMLPDRSTRS